MREIIFLAGILFPLFITNPKAFAEAENFSYYKVYSGVSFAGDGKYYTLVEDFPRVDSTQTASQVHVPCEMSFIVTAKEFESKILGRVIAVKALSKSFNCLLKDENKRKLTASQQRRCNHKVLHIHKK